MSDIFFTEDGKGKSTIPLVLVHGFCETHEIWNNFRTKLGEHFHVLCPDLPGFGKSSSLPEGFTIEDVADALKDWLNKQGINECVMIGHSLGGYVSLAFLEKYGDMLHGLGMFHSTAYADTEKKRKNRNNVIDFVQKYGIVTFIESFVPQLFFHKNRSRLQNEIEKVVEIGKTTSEEALIGYTRAMQKRPERLSVLQTFRKPILYIIGEEDTSVPLEDGQRQVKSLSNYEAHILKETGHIGMLEKQEETFDIVHRFTECTIKQKSS